MISVLMPTRNRPTELIRAIASIRDTSTEFVDVVIYVDVDACHFPVLEGVHVIVGPRIVLSDTWNECAAKALGDILMMGADDMVFRTPGWDEMIEDAFAKSPDKILMVHGDDLAFGSESFAVFPTVHRKWVDTVGYFIPPYFVGNCCDSWLNDVASALGRRKFLPYVTEHMHWMKGKSENDSTYRERAEKERLDPPQALYDRLEPERLKDIEKLRAVMDA